MVAFSTVKPGDVLWDCHKVRAGNSTRRRMGCWQVHVISVHEENRALAGRTFVDRYAVASWNGNPARKYSEHSLKKLRRTKVETKPL